MHSDGLCFDLQDHIIRSIAVFFGLFVLLMLDLGQFLGLASGVNLFVHGVAFVAGFDSTITWR